MTWAWSSSSSNVPVDLLLRSLEEAVQGNLDEEDHLSHGRFSRGRQGVGANRGYAGSRRLSQRHVQVLDRLVDLARALVADRHAIDARLPERKLHRLLPVLAVECALADELHRDDAHSFPPSLLHVLDDLGDVPLTLGVVVLGVHGLALVIPPDHGAVEPF